MATTTDALGHVTRFEYDSLNRKITETNAQSNATHFAYDGVGNLISIIDPLGNVARFTYDARGRIVESLDPDGGRIQFAYDADDNLVVVTDPRGNDTSFAYDARNRVLSETNELGATRLFAYDAANRLTSRTDRNGRVRQFAYDDLNRPISETWVGGGNVLQYAYDRASNLLTAADVLSSLAVSYDARDRVQTVSNAGTPNAPPVVLTYLYDATGNVFSAADAISGVAAGVSSYTSDALDRLVRLTQSGTGVAAKRVDFAYNAVGQYASIARFADLAGTQSVVTSNYAYDTLNRLTALTHSGTGGSVAFFNFTFDAAGRITGTSDADGATTFSYDDRGQLTAAEHADPAVPDETYQYDSNGNRVSSHVHGAAYQAGQDNRILSDGTFNYVYDAEGNMTRRTEIATGNFREFTWDFRNRLTVVVDRDAMGAELQRVEFTYDAFDRRVSKSLQSATDNALTHFVQDRGDVLLEFVDSDGAAGPAVPTLAMRYLHGNAVDQILAQEDSAGIVLWQLGDHLGTVHDLVDSTGAVVNHIKYDSFGNVLSESNPAAASRYLFTGRERDAETGLYNYRSRYYDPSIGRFVSADTVGFTGGDANLYRYVGNAPSRFTDPTGHGIVRNDPLEQQIQALRDRAAELQANDDRLLSEIVALYDLQDRLQAEIDKTFEALKNVDKICPESVRERIRQMLQQQLQRLSESLQDARARENELRQRIDQNLQQLGDVLRQLQPLEAALAALNSGGGALDDANQMLNGGGGALAGGGGQVQ